MAVFLVRGGVLTNSPNDQRLRILVDSVQVPVASALKVLVNSPLPMTSERHHLRPSLRDSRLLMGSRSFYDGRGRCVAKCQYLAFGSLNFILEREGI